MKMIVNKERLERLIDGAVVCCEDCPIYEVDDWTTCDKYCQKVDEDTHLKSCAEALLDWLQEFDIAEALEEGAHIVNDQVIFPPEEIPFEPFYGTPCEAATPKGKPGPYCNGKDCDYVDCCPYDW
jgi:hypothetical protein